MIKCFSTQKHSVIVSTRNINVYAFRYIGFVCGSCVGLSVYVSLVIGEVDVLSFQLLVDVVGRLLLLLSLIC